MPRCDEHATSSAADLGRPSFGIPALINTHHAAAVRGLYPQSSRSRNVRLLVISRKRASKHAQASRRSIASKRTPADILLTASTPAPALHRSAQLLLSLTKTSVAHNSVSARSIRAPLRRYEWQVRFNVPDLGHETRQHMHPDRRERRCTALPCMQSRCDMYRLEKT